MSRVDKRRASTIPRAAGRDLAGSGDVGGIEPQPGCGVGRATKGGRCGVFRVTLPPLSFTAEVGEAGDRPEPPLALTR